MKSTRLLSLSPLVLFFVVYLLSPNLERFKHSVPGQYVSYSDLEAIEDYLSQNEFTEADKITTEVLLKISNREKKNWIGQASINDLSCQYLLVIEDIWNRQSGGEWGFIAQDGIWRELGGRLGYHNPAVEQRFRDIVWNQTEQTKGKGFYPKKLYETGAVTAPYVVKKLNDCENRTVSR